MPESHPDTSGPGWRLVRLPATTMVSDASGTHATFEIPIPLGVTHANIFATATKAYPGVETFKLYGTQYAGDESIKYGGLIELGSIAYNDPARGSIMYEMPLASKSLRLRLQSTIDQGPDVMPTGQVNVLFYNRAVRYP